MNLCSISDVKALLHQHDIRPNRRYGQNFLIDRNVLNSILRATGLQPGGCVLEIGPGLGCLTVELAAQASKVVAVDIDPVMIEMLHITLTGCPNVRTVNADILRTTPSQLGIPQDSGWILLGNLPYYITSPILEWIAANMRHFCRSVLMVQREVADRLLASPGTPDYGSLTVYLNYHFKITRAANVSRNVFYPSPDVDSGVVVLDTREEPAVNVADEAMLFSVIRSAFAMRRKTLENALGLSAQLKWGKERARAILEGADIDPSMRGERLSIADFGRIANCASMQQQ